MRNSRLLSIFTISAAMMAMPVLTSGNLTLQASPIFVVSNSFVPFENAIPARNVNGSMMNQNITVEGVIESVRESWNDRAPHLIIMNSQADNNGRQAEFSVVYWPNQAMEVLGTSELPEPGKRLSITGQLTEHQGNLQIRARDAASIRIEGLTRAPQITTSSTTVAIQFPPPDANGYYDLQTIMNHRRVLIDNDMSIRGTVTEFVEPWSDTAPNIIRMGQGNQTLELVFWSSVAMDLKDDFTQPGTPVYATGRLSEFRDRLQIRIEDPDFLRASPLPASYVVGQVKEHVPYEGRASDGWPDAPGNRGYMPAIDRQQLSPNQEVSAADVQMNIEGSDISLTAEVIAIVQTEKGRVLVVRDDSGTALVKLTNQVQIPGLEEGKRIQAKGKVAMHDSRHRAEVRVDSVSQIQILN